jgi:hypothetical protein
MLHFPGFQAHWNPVRVEMGGMKMDRKDWVWITVKAFGIFLGIRALETLPPLVTSFKLVVDSGISPGSPAMLPVWQQFITLFIFVNLSLYFLKSGRLVFSLIGMRETPSK